VEKFPLVDFSLLGTGLVLAQITWFFFSEEDQVISAFWEEETLAF